MTDTIANMDLVAGYIITQQDSVIDQQRKALEEMEELTDELYDIIDDLKAKLKLMQLK